MAENDMLTICPVCYDALWSPILQCINRHFICEACISRVNNRCPSCRAQLPAIRIRDREIEKQIMERQLPCPFEEEGCTDTSSHARLDCPVACQKYCQFLGLTDCQEKRPRRDVWAHLFLAHGLLLAFISLGDTVKVRQSVPRLEMAYVRLLWPPIAFETREGQLFYLATRLVQRRVQWEVFVLGSERVASGFSARIRLQNGHASDRECRHLEWFGPLKGSMKYMEDSLDHYDSFGTFSFEFEDLLRSCSSSSTGEINWLLEVTVVNNPDQPGTETDSAYPWLNNQAIVELREVPAMLQPSVWRRRDGVSGTERRSQGNSSRAAPPMYAVSNINFGQLNLQQQIFHTFSRSPAHVFAPARVYLASAAESRSNVHENILCNRCRESSIAGRRYKCLWCPDFNLCSTCISDTSTEHPHGLFLMSFFERQLLELHLAVQRIQENLQPLRYSELGGNPTDSHAGITCDGCGLVNFLGPRHKCVACPDYDLCINCIGFVAHTHALFLVLLYPGTWERMEIAFRYVRDEPQMTA